MYNRDIDNSKPVSDDSTIRQILNEEGIPFDRNWDSYYAGIRDFGMDRNKRRSNDAYKIGRKLAKRHGIIRGQWRKFYYGRS